MEVSERRLDDMMRQRVALAMELQNMREGLNEAAPIFNIRHFPPATVRLLKLTINHSNAFRKH
jgi:hypothetical protein